MIAKVNHQFFSGYCTDKKVMMLKFQRN